MWECTDRDRPNLVTTSQRLGRVPGDFLKRGKVRAKDNPERLMAVVEDGGGKMGQNPMVFAQEMAGKVERTVEGAILSAEQVGGAVQNWGKNAWAFAGSRMSQPGRMPVVVRAG